MSTKYKAIEPNAAYFITLTTVGWIDVFTRVPQKHLLINSLQYCQDNKGLELYAYCIMTNHLHLLCRAKEDYKLSDIVRDFKKYTSKKSFILSGNILRAAGSGCWSILNRPASP